MRTEDATVLTAILTVYAIQLTWMPVVYAQVRLNFNLANVPTWKHFFGLAFCRSKTFFLN